MATFSIDGKIKEVVLKDLSNGGQMAEVMVEEPKKTGGVTLYAISAFGQAIQTAQKLSGRSVKIDGFVNSREYNGKIYCNLSANKFYLNLEEPKPATPPPSKPETSMEKNLDEVPF